MSLKRSDKGQYLLKLSAQRKESLEEREISIHKTSNDEPILLEIIEYCDSKASHQILKFLFFVILFYFIIGFFQSLPKTVSPPCIMQLHDDVFVGDALTN